MPQAFAGAGIQGEQGIAEQIGAFPVGAVEVVLRARRWRVYNAALLVEGELPPDIRPAHALPCILRPRIIPELARTWNRVKRPLELTRAYIESAYIAGSRTVSLIGCGAQNQQILKYTSRRCGLHQPDVLRIAIQPLFQIDAAAIAERKDRPPCLRVDRTEKMVAGK